jgi:hypothetical protein
MRACSQAVNQGILAWHDQQRNNGMAPTPPE